MAIFRDTTRDQKSDRSAGDRRRHREIVKQAISGNIADILSEESIIGKDRDRIVKVPIKGKKEYRFVYGENAPGAGQGSGNSQPGQSGDRSGVDYYETDITLEELIDMMFEDLQLPHMERKRLAQIEVESKSKRVGYKKRGIWAHISLPRTAVERVKRLKQTQRAIHQRELEIGNMINELSTVYDHEKRRELRKKIDEGKERLEELYELENVLSNPEKFRKHLQDNPEEKGRFRYKRDDLRFHRRKQKPRHESNAVVICVMDTSGSMDTIKKYLARSFFFLLYNFVRRRYAQTELVFIAHHTEAKEVTEEEFFHKGESGGTFISSGYAKALEIISDRYHPSLWNVYAFHCSDGDNFESDNPAALKTAEELAEVCNLFGYGEIKPVGSDYRGNSMIQFFAQIKARHFQAVEIQKKEDIWPKFKDFMSRSKNKEELL